MQMNLKHNSRLTVHSKEAEVRVNTGILQMVNTSLADSDMDSEEVMRADSLTSLKNCSDITAPEQTLTGRIPRTGHRSRTATQPA